MRERTKRILSFLLSVVILVCYTPIVSIKAEIGESVPEYARIYYEFYKNNIESPTGISDADIADLDDDAIPELLVIRSSMGGDSYLNHEQIYQKKYDVVIEAYKYLDGTVNLVAIFDFRISTVSGDSYQSYHLAKYNGRSFLYEKKNIYFDVYSLYEIGENMAFKPYLCFINDSGRYNDHLDSSKSISESTFNDTISKIIEDDYSWNMNGWNIFGGSDGGIEFVNISNGERLKKYFGQVWDFTSDTLPDYSKLYNDFLTDEMLNVYNQPLETPIDLTKGDIPSLDIDGKNALVTAKIADLNNDGIPELLVARYKQDDITGSLIFDVYSCINNRVTKVEQADIFNGVMRQASITNAYLLDMDFGKAVLVRIDCAFGEGMYQRYNIYKFDTSGFYSVADYLYASEESIGDRVVTDILQNRYFKVIIDHVEGNQQPVHDSKTSGAELKIKSTDKNGEYLRDEYGNIIWETYKGFPQYYDLKEAEQFLHIEVEPESVYSFGYLDNPSDKFTYTVTTDSLLLKDAERSALVVDSIEKSTSLDIKLIILIALPSALLGGAVVFIFLRSRPLA